MSFDQVKERREAYGMFNKKTGEFTFLNQPEKGIPGFCDDVLNGPPITLQYLSGDNIGVQSISPVELKDYVSRHKVSANLKDIANGIKEEDNPIVVLVYFH